MTGDRHELDELRAALAPLGSLTSEQPSDSLHDRMLDRALAIRQAGRALGSAPAVSAAQVYTVVCDGLRSVLDELAHDDWSAPTVYGISVTELVSHLAAVEHFVGDRLGLWAASIDESAGHLAMGISERGAAPGEATDSWRERARAVVAHAEQLDETGLARPLSMHGVDLTVGEILVVRAFETWSHTEDICRAAGRPLRDVPGPVVHAMASQGVALLRSLADGSADHRGKTFRVTLTGTGAGSWPCRVGPGGVGVADRTDATIVADAMDFCRLFADRIDPGELTVDRLGDIALVDELLTIAPMLADYGERGGSI